MDTFEGQDERTPGWFWSDNEIVDVHAAKIGIHAFGVYHVLLRYLNKRRQCWPSTSTIAKTLGISQRTVVKAIHTLESHGLITIEARTETGKGQVSHRYTVKSAKSVQPKQTTPTPMHILHRGYARDAQPPMHEMQDPYARDAHEQDLKNKTQENNDGARAEPSPSPTTSPGIHQSLYELGLNPKQIRILLAKRPDFSPDDLGNCQSWLAACTANNPIAVLWSHWLSEGVTPPMPAAPPSTRGATDPSKNAVALATLYATLKGKGDSFADTTA